jgi:hypothetical protein
MKQIFILAALTVLTLTACKKDKLDTIPDDFPRTDVPGELQGSWMYGYFSMTEYWSRDPSTYVGNAFELAIAFTFNANGTYKQYFTSKTGGTAFIQSVTDGTVEVDATTKSFKTHPFKAHYRKTENGSVVEERDLTGTELTSAATYTYTTGVETSGTKAVYLTLNGTNTPYTFLQVP